LKNKKSGFVSLIGRPSSGKSTLINRICGFKVSIVSKHPQTTRFLVKGIYNDDDSQIVFVDSPGYHHFNSNLNKGLSNLAVRNLTDADLILYLVDSTRQFGDEEREIISKLKVYEKNVIVVFNKIDDKNSFNTNVKDKFKEELDAVAFVEVSALNGKNVKDLIEIIKNNLQEGPMFYPEDYVTDQAIPFRVSEIVREKIFKNTKEEVPHGTYVEVDSFTITEEKLIAKATIYVERETQKGIVIGKGGLMIKRIGQDARKDLQKIFERDVDLFLNVKVHLNWKKDDKLLKKMFQLDG
jgi:GTPase